MNQRRKMGVIIRTLDRPEFRQPAGERQTLSAGC